MPLDDDEGSVLVLVDPPACTGLAWDALHDALTGLANRRLLEDRLGQALARSKRAGTVVVVVFIDLDGFKAVNDRWGHEAGDALLREVARGLQAKLRPNDTLARFGGDEFVALCELSSPAQLGGLQRRLRSAISDVALPDGRSAQGSLGTAIAHDATAAPTDVLRAADMAMYDAKRRGRQLGCTDLPAWQGTPTPAPVLVDLRVRYVAGPIEDRGAAASGGQTSGS
jgi:diguanylate cyclase (GGDEF)-like protein